MDKRGGELHQAEISRCNCVLYRLRLQRGSELLAEGAKCICHFRERMRTRVYRSSPQQSATLTPPDDSRVNGARTFAGQAIPTVSMRKTGWPGYGFRGTSPTTVTPAPRAESTAAMTSPYEMPSAPFTNRTRRTRPSNTSRNLAPSLARSIGSAFKAY